MRITPQNLVDLLKYAEQEVRALSSELEKEKEVKRAMLLVSPLERRGISLPGANLLEKAAALVNRRDYKELAYMAEHAPAEYRGIGSVGDKPSKGLNPLDAAVLS